MSVSAARAAAFDILLRVQQEHSYASELLHSQTYANLSNPDHGLATELVMGVLRWRSLLDAVIQKQASQPLQKMDIEVLIALRIAVYQLRFLPRVPGRAAVNESVELVKRARKRSAVPFANAILRKLAREADAVSSEPDSGEHEQFEDAAKIAAGWAHPQWMVERWIANFGVDSVKLICRYNQAIPATCLRIAGDQDQVEAELASDGVKLSSGRLLKSARYVVEGNITGTRAYAEGRVAIHDEASQLVAMLVGRGARILDCCAAPGGKTRVLAENNPQAIVIAVELHAHRSRLLRKLVPNSNVEVQTGDILDLALDSAFDRVLVDVPCSGTGTLARNPEIKWELSLADLADLQTRQTAILRAAMRHVGIGGRLVYSTCSLEPEENSQVLEQALHDNSSFQIIDCKAILEELRVSGELVVDDLGSVTSGSFLRTVPGVYPCDGFFAAVLEKKSQSA